MTPAKTVLQHANPAHADYKLDDGKAAAALVPADQVQNIVHPDEYPEKREDLTGKLRMTRGQLKELATDIQVNGLDQDVVMRRLADGLYEIVDGTHRGSAHVDAGYDTIPARFRDDYDDQAAAMRRILANELREDLSPLQQALDWQQALDTGIDQKTLAAKIGKSPGTVSKRLALLKVPTAIAKLAGGLIPLDEVAWWKPLHGHDELAEKVAAAIEKQGVPISQYARRGIVIRCLGVGEASLGAAPLDAEWVAKAVKISSWDLHGFADASYRKKARQLDHVDFGTKSNSDLLIVWDVPAAKELALAATEKIRAKKAKQQEASEEANATVKAEQLKRQAITAAVDARCAQRTAERLGRVKKLDEDMQAALARLWLKECSWGGEVIDGPALDQLVQLVGKHAGVLDIDPDADPEERYALVDCQIFDELLAKSKTAAWQYLAFAVAEIGRTTHDQAVAAGVHELFVGESSEDTAKAAEKAVSKETTQEEPKMEPECEECHLILQKGEKKICNDCKAETEVVA